MRDFTEILGKRTDFAKTPWPLIRRADDPKKLDSLIKIYWKPLYCFVRHHGHGNEEAKDIVQDFLSGLIERQAFAKADPARGRFRTFLLSSLVNFMKDRAKGEARQKRSSDKPQFSLDASQGEAEFREYAGSGEAPEKILDRAWARSLWKQALDELDGEPSHVEAFRLFLDDVPYEKICAKTGLSESAAKTAVHRLKGRLRDIVVGHLQSTLSDEKDLDPEIHEFMELLSEKRSGPLA